MTLLVLWCDSYLETDEIEVLGVDYFACLYTLGFPFKDFDDHFFIDSESILSSKRFENFLKEKEITKVIFHSYELNTFIIRKQFRSIGIEFFRFKRTVIKKNIPFF